MLGSHVASLPSHKRVNNVEPNSRHHHSNRGDSTWEKVSFGGVSSYILYACRGMGLALVLHKLCADPLSPFLTSLSFIPRSRGTFTNR